MSGREAFEETMRVLGFDHPDREYLGAMMQIAWAVWQASDAELAAKDARIAGLEAALRNIKGLPRFDYLGFPSHDGDWLVPADVDDIIEEALR